MLNSNERNNSFTFTSFGNLRTSAIALALMAMLVPGYSNKVEAAPLPMAQNADVEDVSDSTEDYLGQTVTVRGNINEIVDSNSFVLQETKELIGGDKVLVLNASGQPITFADEEGVQVQITGVVRQFRVAELERDFDWDFWDPDLYVEYEDRPAIVAESIALAPEPDDIMDNPELFYGKTIAVKGHVEEYFNTNTFLLEDNDFFQGDELLVINAKTGEIINVDDEVVVTGQLRPFVMADLEREFSINLSMWDIDFRNQIEAEFSNKPVLMADDVYRVGDE